MTSPLDHAEKTHDPMVEQTQLVERGLAVYRQQYCGICHELAAAETVGAFGPPHDQMGFVAVQRIQDTTVVCITNVVIQFACSLGKMM